MYDFGEAHKKYLLHIWDDKKFFAERFAIEGSTKTFKKIYLSSYPRWQIHY